MLVHAQSPSSHLNQRSSPAYHGHHYQEQQSTRALRSSKSSAGTSSTTRRPPLKLQPVKSVGNLRSAPPSSFMSPVGFPSPAPPTSARPAHSSIFRSAAMELRVDSPAAKVLRAQGSERPRSIPIFGDHDVISGAVLLDPQACNGNGKLIITLEGSFVYNAPSTSTAPAQAARHVFFTASTCPTDASSELSTPRSATLRDAFQTIRKRPSQMSLRSTNSASSSIHNFSLELPQSCRSGEDLPPSCSYAQEMTTSPRGRAGVESAQVAYRLLARWQPYEPTTPSPTLEAPILVQPDTDWASLDGMPSQPTPTEWLEVPLKGSDRRGPPTFTCAVTIPSPATFNRSPGSAVPYFVVFTTTPRDPDLAREIASDATIAISLVRVVSANSEASAPIPSSAPPQRRTRAGSIGNWLNRDSVAMSEPSSPSSEETGTEGDAPQSKAGNGRSRLLDRMVRSAPPPLRNRKPSISQLQASSRPGTPGPVSAMQPGPSGLASAPPSPPPPVLDTRTLQTDVAVGFPKRPRHPGAKHPPLPGAELDGGLPDGLHKGQLLLARDMLPGIEWTGLRIKYYLDVSVLYGQDELRARVPIRIY